jgi:hypothetical protein
MSLLIVLFTMLSIFLVVASFILQAYGTVLCFKKKWYMGLAALAVPGFALVVGAAKAFFKKDLLT